MNDQAEESEFLVQKEKCISQKTFREMDSRTLLKPQVVFLDFDNTLVNSWPKDFETSNEVFKCLGYPPMTADEMIREPHTPTVPSIAQRTGHSHERVKEIYNKIYERVHQELAPPLAGAEDLLKYLKTSGIWTMILSNKENDLLKTTLERMRWMKYVNAYQGAEKESPYKPDPAIIRALLERYHLDVSKNQIFFVGDSLTTDIECALRAGIIPVWLSQYSTDEIKMGDFGPQILKTKNNLTLHSLLVSLDQPKNVI